MRAFTVNRKLRRILDERHISHARFADAINMRRDTFSRVVNEKRPLFADELVPIAKELNKFGVPLDELFAESEPTKTA